VFLFECFDHVVGTARAQAERGELAFTAASSRLGFSAQRSALGSMDLLMLPAQPRNWRRGLHGPGFCQVTLDFAAATGVTPDCGIAFVGVASCRDALCEREIPA
jgi:hypothetical protein